MANTLAHYDRIGREIKIGDVVAYPDNNRMEIGIITKLNKIMVKVKKMGNGQHIRSGWTARDRGEKNRYPADIVVIDGPDVTMYILRESHVK